MVGVVVFLGSSSKAYQAPGAIEIFRIPDPEMAVASPEVQVFKALKATPTSHREKSVLAGTEL